MNKQPIIGADAIPRDYFWAFFAAAMGMLAQPSASLYPLAYIMLVPLLAALEGKRNRSAFGIGYVFGAFYYMFLMWWSLPFSVPGVVAMTFLEAFAWGAFGLSYTWFRRHTKLPIWAAAAIPWTAAELLRGSTQVGVTWGWLAYSQWNCLPAIQIAEIIGAIGVGFLIVSSNGLLWSAIKQENWRKKLIKLAWLFGFLGIWIGCGALMIPVENPSPPYTAVLCQGNVDHKRNDDRQREPIIYEFLTRDAAKRRPDLIIWPESAADVNVGENKYGMERLTKSILPTGADLITGVDEDYYEGDQWVYYNSAAHFTPDGLLAGSYRKMMLVPFGEYVPFGLRSIKALESMVADASQYGRGDEFKIFESSRGFKFNILICWESTFGDLARKFCAEGSELTVVITNDGWFGNTSAPYQHAFISTLRAVENRTWIVRAANTGVCLAVDPAGRITGRTEIFKRTILPVSFGLRERTTIYTMVGDLFGWIVVILWVLLLLITILARRIPRSLTRWLLKE